MSEKFPGHGIVGPTGGPGSAAPTQLSGQKDFPKISTPKSLPYSTRLMKSLPYSAHLFQQKRFLAKSLPYSTIFTKSLPDPLARIRFYLHKDFRAVEIRFYLHKEFRVAEISFYLHKDFRAAEIGFSLHKEFFIRKIMKNQWYVSKFSALRALIC